MDKVEGAFWSWIEPQKGGPPLLKFRVVYDGKEWDAELPLKQVKEEEKTT